MHFYIAPPWLVWGIIPAILFSVIPVGSVLAARKKRTGKAFLGVYTAFWGGEGICFVIDEALTSYVLHGHVPHAFYTDWWFFPFYVVLFLGAAKLTDRFEDDAEKRGRPKTIRGWLDQRLQNKFTVPTTFTLTVFSGFVVADYGPHWAWIAFAAVTAFWWIGLLLVWDGRKNMPQNEAQWMEFHPIVIFLFVSALAAVQFAT